MDIDKASKLIEIKVVPENSKSITREIICTNTDTKESFKVVEIYRDGYFILEMNETQMKKINLNNPSEFKVSDFKIIDHELDDVTYSDADSDIIDELEDKGILKEESIYFIEGPLEITKMSK